MEKTVFVFEKRAFLFKRLAERWIGEELLTQLKDIKKKSWGVIKNFSLRYSTKLQKAKMSPTCRLGPFCSRDNAQKELQQKESDIVKPIMDKVKASIQKVGKAKGFQYVLNSEGLLLADGPNLTADVKKDLGF